MPYQLHNTSQRGITEWKKEMPSTEQNDSYPFSYSQCRLLEMRMLLLALNVGPTMRRTITALLSHLGD